MTGSKNFFGAIDNVVLQKYHPSYPMRFEREVESLKSVFRNKKARYHHIGSTAIPEILSKPVIDIAVERAEFPLSEMEIKKVASLGYVFWDSNPNKDHQFFFKGLPRRYHLHLYPENHPKLADQLTFRDKLKADIELRLAYQVLKLRLAREYESDREQYTNQKAGFIRKVVKGKI